MKWIFRIIKATLFGAVCAGLGYLFGVLMFGILQLFLGWSKESTYTIVWIFAICTALWGFVTIIRNSIEDDQDEDMIKAYENLTGEKYTNAPSWESIGNNPPQKQTNGSYTHKDAYGVITGFTTTNGNSAEHYSFDGYSASYKSDNDIVHYGIDGYHGSSVISDDGKTVTHYGKEHRRSGYSKKNSDGTVDHFDEWGLYTGSSKKD